MHTVLVGTRSLCLRSFTPLMLCITALFFVVFSTAQAESTPAATTFPHAFSHYADRQALPDALAAFARAQGYNAEISPEITGDLSGQFDNVPPHDFLDAMHAAFDVRWYVAGKTLHFYNNTETRHANVAPRSISAKELRHALLQSPNASAELPPTLINNGNLLSLTGPQAYIDALTQDIALYEQALNGQPIMRVFPLKYAWAGDMSVQSMDSTVTVPGIASILRSMASGGALQTAQVVQKSNTVNKMDGLGGTGLANNSAPAAPAPQAEQTTPAGMANIIADPRVNAVIINDVPYRMGYYKDVIETLDKPVELVEIHAAIVDIDVNFKRALGINYSAKTGNSNDGWSGGGTAGGNENTFNPDPSISTADVSGLALSTIYKHGADFFMARITALENSGGGRVLGRPSVLTVDNVQATLENTQTYYIPIEGQESADLFKIESGTILRVTPHIITENGKKSIKLAVNVQDNQGDDSAPITKTDDTATIAPVKQTKITTQAVIGENQSLLIGGYSYETKRDGESGIPGLMNIPLLGHLFKTSNKNTQRMERLILITPRIVKLDELPAPPARVHEPDFLQSPTQNNYEPQMITEAPAQTTGGGCARKSVSPALPSAPQQTTGESIAPDNMAKAQATGMIAPQNGTDTAKSSSGVTSNKSGNTGSHSAVSAVGKSGKSNTPATPNSSGTPNVSSAPFAVEPPAQQQSTSSVHEATL